jgi:biotin synthase
MVERIQWARDLGMTVGLFALTPVRGTHLSGSQPPPLAVYRRMQAARWLIAHDRACLEEMVFDGDGCLTGLGASPPLTGDPFQTSGCPDCNRPYYNERPGGVMYNYPRPLTSDEAVRAITEMEIKV